MSYASSSLRSMSTASSGLSSLSTYMPLAGGKMQDGAILYAVAAAVTVLANCDVQEMKCKDVRPVIAAALVGVALFACKKKDCQLNLGFKKVNLQGMLLGGLATYAAYIALRYLFSSTNLFFGLGDMLLQTRAAKAVDQAAKEVIVKPTQALVDALPPAPEPPRSETRGNRGST